jgi:His-Xaa-Ser system protein HxsD
VVGTFNAAPSLTFQDGAIHAVVDLRAYRLAAVQKSAYRIADRCTAVLGELAGDSLPLTFLFPAGANEEAALATVKLFFQDLLDQELREKVSEETKPIRALILAQAFSRTDLVRRR